MKFWIPFLSSVIYFVFSLIYLYFNGYNEDAYILFCYSENFSEYGTISYYPKGPPAEGATDFLWMVLLSFLNSIKIPTYISVTLLNSIGAFIISSIIISFGKIEKTWFSIVIGLSWLISLGVVSSFSGFSTIFYASVVLSCIWAIYNNKKYLPFLLLTLSLIRPDGVILSIGFFLLTLFWSPYNKNFFKDYFLGYIITSLLGVVYFIWRVHYFGEILPLPLLVKSNSTTSIFPGLESNLHFIIRNSFLLIPLIFLLFKSRKEVILKYIPFIIPGFLLFLSLLFAHQSQNVGFRFQFPLWISCYLLLIILIRNQLSYISTKNTFVLVLLLMVTLHSMKVFRKALFSNEHYIDSFSINFLKNIQRLKAKNIRVALTEAGRFTYWTKPLEFEVFDLIGLNTKEVSKKPVSTFYLDSLNPDIIFFHHCSLIDPKEGLKSNFIRINNPIEILPNSFNPITRETQVSSTLLKYLVDNYNEFNIYLVDYTNDERFLHVFGLKKSVGLDSTFINSIESSFNKRTSFFNKLYIRDQHKSSL